MLNFVKVEVMSDGRRHQYIAPNYIYKKDDIMIKGGDFYAYYDYDTGLWSYDELELLSKIDDDVSVFAEKHPDITDIRYCNSYNGKSWQSFKNYCKLHPEQNMQLDNKVVFKSEKTEKYDYVTKKLSYDMEDGEPEAYNKLMSVLYSPDERQKIEWAIGSIIHGDSKYIQKFIVLFGGPGTGKSTVLNIIDDMFEHLSANVNIKEIAKSKSDFALECFKNNPLVGIDQDSDLSIINDNSTLNTLVSHEMVEMNEKHKNKYSMRMNTFIFAGSNKPVQITDSKSGLLRRLIDVQPTGNKIPTKEYVRLVKEIHNERGKIARKCLDIYEKLGKYYYMNYIPMSMVSMTNHLYNFIMDDFEFFTNNSEIMPLVSAWERYKRYTEDSKIAYTLNKQKFKYELMDYYEEFKDRYGTQVNVYLNLKKDKFNYSTDKPELIADPVKDKREYNNGWLKFSDEYESEFDDIFKDCPAQYSTTGPEKKPVGRWDRCKTTLAEIDTRILHYVRVPENLITIDFDIKNEKGEKDYELNFEEALKWPQTYAELSQSGQGIHLHYYYNGNIDELKKLFKKDVEIKVSKGNSALRRRLTKCNDIPIATITSGLPLKERSSNMLDEFVVSSERQIRTMIEKNLRKEYHANTTPSINYIYKILEDAYSSGLIYDVSDMRNDILMFALQSTNQAQYCLKLVSKMKFKSEEEGENSERYQKINGSEPPIVFFDIEIFPNLFIVCYKKQGDGNKVEKLINPKPDAIEKLTKMRLIGFNNRNYDNHILYAAMMGYSVEQLYNLSQRIIVDEDKDAKFREAYNLSYSDVYDFLSSGNKMSLKKWEIQLGIHHQEFGYRWDEPVPEDKWKEAADYCANDVVATEATFNANHADWLARNILADIAGMTVNDTTNTLTTKIIIGDDRDPWSKYIYTDLSTIFPGYRFDPYGIPKEEYNDGTKIVAGKSIYMGEDPGEGGYVYAEPGIYYNVALLDIASMHPNSLIQLNLFGDEYTMRFSEIVRARLLIKHKEYDEAKKILDGKLAKYLDNPDEAKALANALKTAINSVYGLTSAKFKHKLKDPRNIDNIVAKRGALFMINLKHKVQEMGYTVVHIKTDSIKIANADEKIIKFVMDYGREYGYTFEHEATYERICLVNESTYIAKDAADGHWTATGTQFQVPYVFKSLFSKEPITFEDLCETKTATTALYLDYNEDKDLPFVDDESEKHDYRFIGRVGSFCPVVDGAGGGILLRQDTNDPNKFSAVQGTKKKHTKNDVYRFLEAETVIKLGLKDKINQGYFIDSAEEAIETINKFGDFDEFVGNKDFVKIPDSIPEDVEAMDFEQYMNSPMVSVA